MPEPLRTHLQLRSRENKTFDEVLDCIEGYLKAKEVWRDEESDKQNHKRGKKGDDGGMQPMDVDAVWKGGKGKGGAKGGKGACFTCGKTGHQAKDCWSAGKGAKGGKGKGKEGKGKEGAKGGKGDYKGGKAGGKGVCYNCGKPGHMSKYCWSPRTQHSPHQVHMVDQPQYEQTWTAPAQQQMQTPWQQPMYQLPPPPMGTASSVSSNASTVPTSQYQQPIPLRAVYVEEIGRPKPWMIFGLQIVGEEKQQRKPTPEEINAVRRRKTSYEKLVLDSGSQVHACPPEHGYAAIRVGKHLPLASASGQAITHYGQKTVIYESSNEINAAVEYEVSDVTKPLMSAMKMIKSNKRIILDMSDYGQSTSTVFDKHTGKIINIDIDNDTFVLDMTPVQQQNNVEEAIWVMPVNVVPEAEEMRQEEETFEEFIGPQPVPAAVAASSGDTAAAADADELQVADPFLGPRELKVPQRPSALEQQQHALSHVPRQPWCEVCV
ncbi:unnamed protein product [Polarella glacialis]|uniref:CCHC-type domain-containing protein n=1 Tax=Polarella glacialis TaxID=89957 RepID=A0A813JLD1_POLGL|nr:unnamed protein product [Polarella glacialis]